MSQTLHAYRLTKYVYVQNQEVMTYKDSDESMTCNAVRALQQAKEQNNTAMSVVSSNSRASNISESILTNHISEISSSSYLHIWGAENVSNQRQRTFDVLNIINTFLAHASSQNLNVVAMVIDSTSAYASA
ncbi:14223_t:CDS:2, partial [Cetraspora pellucida]